jgi:hypothetical protein
VTVLMAARLWLWAAMVRPLKHVVPLGTLVRIAHRAPRVGADAEVVRRQLEGFLRRSGRAPTRAPANCLERSLGAYRLLCAAGAAPELVVGLRRGSGTSVDGHVWVEVAGCPLAEDESFLARFARLLTFDSNGRQTSGYAVMPQRMRLS